MKQEAWRFTSVAPIAETTFELANPAAPLPSRAELEPFLLGDVAPHRLVFVDGYYAQSLSTVGFPAGGRVESLAQALIDDPGTIEQPLWQDAATEEPPV